jgi:hypothetical protein
MIEHHPDRQGPVLLAPELHLPQATSVDVSRILVKKMTDLKPLQVKLYITSTSSQPPSMLWASSLLIPEHENCTITENSHDFYTIIGKPVSHFLSLLLLLSHLQMLSSP